MKISAVLPPLAILLIAGVAKAQSVPRPTSASRSSLPAPSCRIALSRRPHPRRQRPRRPRRRRPNPSGGADRRDCRIVPGDKLNIRSTRTRNCHSSSRSGRWKDHARWSATSGLKAGPRPASRFAVESLKIQQQPRRHSDRHRDGSAGVLRDGRGQRQALALRGQISMVQALAITAGSRTSPRRRTSSSSERVRPVSQRCRSITTMRSRAGRRWCTCSPATRSSSRKPG
jgi:hypothetical protein